MLARWIATVAALLLACAQASAHVRAERVGDLVNLADVTAPLGDLAQPSKTALPARASLGEPAPGENPHVTPCHVWQKSFPTTKSTSGTTIWRWDSAPFGDTAANEQPTVGLASFTLNLRFPGQQYDRETGTHYNYFRDYEAQTGRYVQSDPIGIWDELTSFSYVWASPTDSFDPYGMGRCNRYLRLLGLCKKPVIPPKLVPVPSGGGVYLFINCHGMVVYVGKADDFRARMSAHRNDESGQWKAFDEPCCPVIPTFIPVPAANRAAEELRLIRLYTPPGNVQHNRQPRPYAAPCC